MNLIRGAIERPIAVMAAVMMVIMFGLVALKVIPIQLIPDIRKPVISVRTNWPGAAPAEIEREITNRQEDVLRGLEGLEEMRSSSQSGRARITLEFAVGQEMDRALLLVANRLDRISDYPNEADEPSLDTAGSEDSPIAWFVLKRTEGNTREMRTFGDFTKDVVQDRLERVSGVARVNVFGGAEREMVVTVNPAEMSRFGLTVPKLVDALRAANASLTAGDVEEGKRRYVVRTEGELSTPEQVANVAVRTISDRATGRIARVRLGDVAQVGFGYKDTLARIRHLGEPAIAMNATGDTGANVIETMRDVRAAVVELNKGLLAANGLYLTQVYDETVYIDSALNLVQQNIWAGGVLAAIVLLVFLRSGRATLIVSLAIPVSVIGSFVAMAAMGRSLNVISLAGIAFAVGMVVDAAIVVLENIYRLRQEGKSRREAAYLGAQQVWAAVLVSALTTVMVFVPLLVMKLEVGQLFRDIAVAISVSVSLSLVVAITVIPALSNRLLKETFSDSTAHFRLPLIDEFGRWFVRATLDLTRNVTAYPSRSLIMVAVVCGITGASSYVFLPKLEYLPEGNRNLVLGIVIPPPGYNLATTAAIADEVESAVKHLWVSETGPESAEGEPPKIESFFFVALSSRTFVGAKSVDPSRAAELIPVMREPVFKEPGTFGSMFQPSLFGRTLGSGRTVDVNVSGPQLETVLEVAAKAAELMNQVLPRAEGNQFRPKPGLELGAPEVRVIPDSTRLADNGMTVRELGMAVDVFNDGLRVAEITVGGQRIDLTIKGAQGEITETQGIGNLPVVTANGGIVPVSSLARIIVTSGPTEIRHLERERTVTLELRPSPDLPLESAMDILQEKVVDVLQNSDLPPGVRLRLAGTADKLNETWNAMMLDLVIAVIIVYLVMAVLFESFVYPLIILLSVPLATAGGVAGLNILNLFVHQSLDMLTLLGFVILVGIVVNNAILLVHQTLYHQRSKGMEPIAAILEATRNRIRPIFMSTLTSVFGMLPLTAFPGAGAELYRGLGSVVVGGLALSAVLTILILPPLLALIAHASNAANGRVAA